MKNVYECAFNTYLLPSLYGEKGGLKNHTYSIYKDTN